MRESFSMTIFNPENKNINEIFGNADSFYRMPIYQRPYAWDKERVEQLWHDILEAYKNNQEDPEMDPGYFLGSIVVIKKDDNTYEVVDGQQRLTTLTILFCVLRDMEKELSLPQDIAGMINHSIKSLTNSKERLKLTTHLNNQAIFEESILNGIDFNAKKDFIDKNRFLQTAFYFKDLIKNTRDPENHEMYVKNFSGFIEYLFKNTTLIRVVCHEEGFAIKLFTVLNDRGLDLSSSDIIKAYLLQKLDSESKRNSFIEVWKRIEELCKLSNESLQGVLSLYLYYLKNGNPKKVLHDELKSELKGKDPIKTILEIEEFSNHLFSIINDTKDRDISMLKYLPQSIYWKTILTTARQKGYKEYEKLKNTITKYYYQSWIADGTSNRVKQTSFKIIESIKNDKPYPLIREIIMGNLKKYEPYVKSLDRKNIYQEKWHKPLLLAIEYYQQDARDFIEISKSLHTEHILPLEWNRDNLDWCNQFSPKEANELINSLGNLTLLSGSKNIHASNRDFSQKKEIYEGKGIDGKTSFEITKKVLEEYKIWNRDSIEKRKNWLIQEAKRILTI